MQISKVYTRGGDQGLTSLIGGERVSKDAPRIEAYGTIDELNAIVGLARTFTTRSSASSQVIELLESLLCGVQNDLFNVGNELATPVEHHWEGMYVVGTSDVARLEQWIDQLNADLPVLNEFILPGGGPVGAFLHQARTVCRRAERRIITLLGNHPTNDSGCLRYINRLSDFFFVASRYAAKGLGEVEYLWNRPV